METFSRLLIHAIRLPAEWLSHSTPAVWERAHWGSRYLKALFDGSGFHWSWTVAILFVIPHGHPAKHNDGQLSWHSWAEHVLTGISYQWDILTVDRNRTRDWRTHALRRSCQVIILSFWLGPRNGAKCVNGLSLTGLLKWPLTFRAFDPDFFGI